MAVGSATHGYDVALILRTSHIVQFLTFQIPKIQTHEYSGQHLGGPNKYFALAVRMRRNLQRSISFPVTGHWVLMDGQYEQGRL